MTWDMVQVSPTILLLMGSSSTGGQSQSGTGLVRVIDISDPRNIRLVRDVAIPGTVHAFGVAVDGDVAVVTATRRGIPERLAHLRRQRRARHARPERPGQPAARSHGKSGRRGERRRLRSRRSAMACSRSGPEGPPATSRSCTCSTPSDPDHLVYAAIDAPAALQGISGGGNLVFTTDGSSLIVYQILASPGIPVTARVQVPNNTGVAVVPGSFSVAPSQIIAGPDFDTLVFDLTLTADVAQPDDHLAVHGDQLAAGRVTRGHRGVDGRFHQPGHGRPGLVAAPVGGRRADPRSRSGNADRAAGRSRFVHLDSQEPDGDGRDLQSRCPGRAGGAG